MGEIPALEIGGTHVSAAVVDDSTWRPIGPATRRPLRADASPEEFLTAVVAAAARLARGPSPIWGVAIPDPFDYSRGTALYEGVGKFGALYGLDVGAALGPRLGAGGLIFVNDADAFALGEWVRLARTAGGDGPRRCVGITLGTGIGSGWIIDGRPVHHGSGLPPGGRAHRLVVDGVPLEDVMSRRAIRAAYRMSGGDADADVAAIAAAARAGDAAATSVLRPALSALGTALGPCLRAFGPDVVIVGGSMAGSWDLFEPWFRAGAGDLPPIRVTPDTTASALVGAARHASSAPGGR
ncbi:ROK family protein [Thermomonospora umbrina]|uniref:Glucokinase n=1 Tax=Thermomonospora umbrina TaxID=111806 RepID=A0A3D9T1R4_9ACTN|nr:ROK family protein [Thermomonospora umbrina]REF00781.1 glucokinase [Thermomonospora umbrina]